MKGILFKPDMIQAIVEGRKTQTRRVMKPQPVQIPDDVPHEKGDYWVDSASARTMVRASSGLMTVNARYQPNETVYIKEAWQVLDVDTRTLDAPVRHVKIEYKDGVQEWGHHLRYYTQFTIPDKWHSPLFLPEKVARYFIKIKSVEAQRLQEITYDDCLNEGIIETRQFMQAPRAYGDFIILWDSINPSYPFASNPWVFKYTLEKVNGH